jgi:hypothetical protein
MFDPDLNSNWAAFDGACTIAIVPEAALHATKLRRDINFNLFNVEPPAMLRAMNPML